MMKAVCASRSGHWVRSAWAAANSAASSATSTPTSGMATLVCRAIITPAPTR